VPQPDLDRRTLKSIAGFTKEMAGRSAFDRMRKKQSDADAIKNWEKELTRAFERFSVCFIAKLNYRLPHQVDRPSHCYKSTLAPLTYRRAKRLPGLDRKLIERMVSIDVQCHHDRHA
jgi:hypothetical protein